MTNTRPSSLELVRAYEERENHPWWDFVFVVVSVAQATRYALIGDAIFTSLWLVAVMFVILMFEQSAQNAYEYQHREGW